MNESQFMLAGDGWVQISPLGEFKHAGAGVTQVIDREACDRIAADFDAPMLAATFPGWPAEAGFELRMEEVERSVS